MYKRQPLVSDVWRPGSPLPPTPPPPPPVLPCGKPAVVESPPEFPPNTRGSGDAETPLLPEFAALGSDPEPPPEPPRADPGLVGVGGAVSPPPPPPATRIISNVALLPPPLVTLNAYGEEGPSIVGLPVKTWKTIFP